MNSESLSVLDVAADGGFSFARGNDAGFRHCGRRGEPDGAGSFRVRLFGPDAISRDGNAVVFSDDTAASGPYYAVCLRKTDGSPAVRLGEGNALDLSSDGKSVLAAVFTTPPRLMIYPTGAGEPRNISFKEFDSYDSGQFFHGGSRILFCGVRAGESSRCYVAETKGGEPQAGHARGNERREDLTRTNAPSSPSSVAEAIAIYPLDGGSPRPLPELTPRTQSPMVRGRAFAPVLPPDARADARRAA